MSDDIPQKDFPQWNPGHYSIPGSWGLSGILLVGDEEPLHYRFPPAREARHRARRQLCGFGENAALQPSFLPSFLPACLPAFLFLSFLLSFSLSFLCATSSSAQELPLPQHVLKPLSHFSAPFNLVVVSGFYLSWNHTLDHGGHSLDSGAPILGCTCGPGITRWAWSST